ncbi:MAG: hypothetical protein HY935_02670 [Nitrosomonadales bacterium]|nr:hypothetical protein [Nitrosomonadales bacterium]
MSGSTITRLPTLCNPDKLSVKELREQYKRLEGDAIEQGLQLSDVCAKLHEMNVLAHNLSASIYALIDSFDANDRPAIALQLRQMSDRRKSYKKPEVH